MFEKMFGFGKEAKRVPEPEDPMLKKYMDQEAQKDLAKGAVLEKKETDIRIKDIKDVKTWAAIEFLGENSPAWAKKFGDLSSVENAKISADTLDAVKVWMSNPDNRYEDGKWISGSIEQAQEKRAAKESKEAKAGQEMTDKLASAKNFFSNLPGWAERLGKMTPDEKDEFYSNFIKDPKSVIKSASWDAKNKEYSAGKIAAGVMES